MIIEGYQEKQKENLYRDIRNAYYTGCFAQVEKPDEFYNSIIESLDSKPQSGEEIFKFLKNMEVRSGSAKDNALDSHFKIPLKLTPDFDVSIFSYIYFIDEDSLEIYLPGVALSLNNELLKPVDGVYSLKPGLVKIKYSEQVYTIVFIRS